MWSSVATFSAASLKGYDLLVISNALGAEKMADSMASHPAFTENPCREARPSFEIPPFGYPRFPHREQHPGPFQKASRWCMKKTVLRDQRWTIKENA